MEHAEHKSTDPAAAGIAADPAADTVAGTGPGTAVEPVGYEVPHHVVLTQGHAVALRTGRFEETRWFQIAATAHPVVFFPSGPGTPAARRDPHATVTVILDGTATANGLADWTVDTLSVSGADRPSVTYFAHPDLAADVLPEVLADADPALPVLPVSLRRGSAQLMSNAPALLRELVAKLVALDPAASSTRADETVTVQSLVREPLAARLAQVLFVIGVDYELLSREAIDALVDGVLSVIAQRFPARRVRFVSADVADVDADLSTADVDR